ncbi:MAG: MarR family transcriptional regulator [Chromatiales bacterium]|jgi:DNA-binding MarR family transcriptional regulator
MSAPKTGPVFTKIVLEVFKLGGLLVQEGDRIAEEYGMTSARWKILGAIAIAGKPQTVSQIARSMGLTRQAVQRLVDAMQQDGFLESRTNPDHKRARLINLSARGKETYSGLDKKQVEWAAERSSGLTQEELDIALSVLKRISESVGL